MSNLEQKSFQKQLANDTDNIEKGINDRNKSKKGTWNILRSKSDLGSNNPEKSKNVDKTIKKSESNIFGTDKSERLHLYLQRKEADLLKSYVSGIDNINKKYSKVFQEVKADGQYVTGKVSYIKRDIKEIYSEEINNLNKDYLELYKNVENAGEEAFWKLQNKYNADRQNIEELLGNSVKYEKERKYIENIYTNGKQQLIEEVSTEINSSDSWRKKFYAGVEKHKESLFRKVAEKKQRSNSA